MKKKTNPHTGSSFDSFLEEVGLEQEVVARVAKRIFIEQLVEKMKTKGINKAFLRRYLKSPTTTERIFNSNYIGTSLETMSKAAAILGCEIKIELIQPGKKHKKAA